MQRVGRSIQGYGGEVSRPHPATSPHAARDAAVAGHLSALSAPAATFRHEALLYAGPTDFLERTTEFVLGALERAEPILVMVPAAKLESLRARLGRKAEDVSFVDMEKIGRNPARIIPAWHAFLSRSSRFDRPVNGIGEPIWPGRSPAELLECQLHESLLNLAFAGGPAGRLLCPYDTDALESAVIEEALRSHPFHDGTQLVGTCPAYRDEPWLRGPFSQLLPEPSRPAAELEFDRHGLADVRSLVAREAEASGLVPQRTSDLVLLAHELAANSVRHAGGRGTVRLWMDDGSMICEVTDGGCIHDPMAGRRRPSPDAEGGRGLWLANQLSDLVQIRSSPAGTAVRLHLALS